VTTKDRFPIQGGLTISMVAAERAYVSYRRMFGGDQSLDRLAERGGFGVMEYVQLYHDIPFRTGRKPSEYQTAQALREGDIRVAEVSG